jgi:hypothetical protein
MFGIFRDRFVPTFTPARAATVSNCSLLDYTKTDSNDLKRRSSHY